MIPQAVAANTLMNYWDLSLPVNPVNIANKLGIRVYYSPALGALGGYYDATNMAIYINERDSRTRQRFSMAHELGHAILGHGSSARYNGQVIRADINPENERAANVFAASLLMPEMAVRAVLGRQGMTSQQLCAEFDVSPSAMSIRLRELGY